LVLIVPSNTNEERVGRCLSHLHHGLKSFIADIMHKVHGDQWASVVQQTLSQSERTFTIPLNPGIGILDTLDTRYLLVLLIKLWDNLFKLHSHLEPFHRSLAHELRQTRNEWAHQVKFSNEDTYRALDNMERLLKSMGDVEHALLVERKDICLLMSDEIQRKRSSPDEASTNNVTLILSPVKRNHGEGDADMMDV